MKKLAIMFSISCQCWALMCSNPICLAEDVEPEMNVAINEGGTAAVVWQEKKGIKIAEKREGTWNVPTRIFDCPKGEKEVLSISGCQVDPSSNISVFWKTKDLKNEMIELWGIERKKGWAEPKFLTNELCDTIVIENSGKYFLFSLPEKKNEPWRLGNFLPSSLEVIEQSLSSAIPEGIHSLGTIENINWYKLAVATSKDDQQFFTIFWKKSLEDEEKGEMLLNGFLRQPNGSWVPTAEMAFVGPGFDWISDLKAAVDSRGNVCIAALISYIDDDSKVIMTRILSSEGEWSDPFKFECERGIYNLQLAEDGLGNFMATWSGWDNSVCAAYKPAGMLWSDPVQVIPREVNVRPILQADSSGNFVLTWLHSGKHVSIYGSCFSVASQRWSLAKKLSPEMYACDSYSLVLNGKGKGLLAWITKDDALSSGTLQVMDVSVE